MLVRLGEVLYWIFGILAAIVLWSLWQSPFDDGPPYTLAHLWERFVNHAWPAIWPALAVWFIGFCCRYVLAGTIPLEKWIELQLIYDAEHWERSAKEMHAVVNKLPPSEARDQYLSFAVHLELVAMDARALKAMKWDSTKFAPRKPQPDPQQKSQPKPEPKPQPKPQDTQADEFLKRVQELEQSLRREQ